MPLLLNSDEQTLTSIQYMWAAKPPPAGPAHFHWSDTHLKKKLPEASGRKTHKHSLTCSLVSLQTVETDSLPISSSSPYTPKDWICQDRPHLSYNICYTQERPFSNIFSLLAEKGNQRFLESKRCFLTKNPSLSLLHVCQLSPNSSWIEWGRGWTHKQEMLTNVKTNIQRAISCTYTHQWKLSCSFPLVSF